MKSWGVGHGICPYSSAILLHVHLPTTCPNVLDLEDSNPVELLFEPGASSVMTTLLFVDDNLLEETEQISIVLANPSRGSVDASGSVARLFIEDSDSKHS
jgi:hypothetical protein